MAKEAQARLKINKMLEESGWRFFDTPEGRPNVIVENNVDLTSLGEDFEKATGFIDYLLLDERGFPLAVLEAKSESKDPVVGKEQALEYAKAKKCNLIILSNGNTTYFWDIRKNAEELIVNLPTQKQLVGLIYRETTKPLSSTAVGKDWIVNSQGGVSESELRYLRDYQIEAVNSIAVGFDGGKRRFLLEMATGTGKTLLAAAVIKLFLKTQNAKRILFIVDTIELADQAEENITSYLKEYNVGIFKNDKIGSLENEVVIATIQSLATNQNYLKFFNDFDFDLIFSDEAHRSVSGMKSRAIFEYFKSTKIGLTATPKDFLKGIDERQLAEDDPRKLERRILMDTYQTFGCESGIPTFRFDLQSAVQHKPPYLVNPIVFDKRSDKTNQMLLADGWKDVFTDSVTGEEIEETFKIRDFERRVFSESLNELMCNELVKTLKRDPISREVGKTIVYCISQNHAAKITRMLNRVADKNWDGKYSGLNGTFARQVTSRIQESQDLSKKFRNNQLGDTRIVVTVRMMTTGYDCPDLLNVVLMKPVFSVSDFIQMKGRGTRLNTFANKLTGVEIPKDTFHLIDFFGVCEYFEESYNYKEPLALGVVTSPASTDHGTESTGSIDTPISVIHGDFIYVGNDFLVVDNQLKIGEDCMKVDRETYLKTFENSVKNLLDIDPDFMKALRNNDFQKAEAMAHNLLMEKPDYFYSLNSLRQIYDSNSSLLDLIKFAGGIIKKLPNKFDVLVEAFKDFKVAHPNLAFRKMKFLENIFDCYFTNDTYRDNLNNGDLSVIDNQKLGGIVPIGELTASDLYEILNFMKGLKISNVH